MRSALVESRQGNNSIYWRDRRHKRTYPGAVHGAQSSPAYAGCHNRKATPLVVLRLFGRYAIGIYQAGRQNQERFGQTGRG